MSQPKKKGAVSLLLEFSIPLLAGVAAALLHANLDLPGYRAVVGWEPFPGASLAGHPVTLQFLVDEVFMAFFFGLAAKEITEACLPGGSLNPPRRAVNPLLATLGGVLGPVLVYFAAFAACRAAGAFAPGLDPAVLARGWGIPTATDIALAWLVARAVFGPGHPAIDFLLLLAVADDGIGLVIIAVFYNDPLHPVEPVWLLCAAAGPALAWALRARRAMRWQAYVFLAGPLAWWGLLRANLHPALALVLVVPFMPGPPRDAGLFAAESMGEGGEGGAPRPLSPLQRYGRDLKPLVDVGLFFFAFANAGVAFAGVGPLTWIVLAALVIGKTCGITAAALLAVRLGFPLPERMGKRELAMAGFVASVGMTVALFVAAAAFTDPDLQGEAKMGALFSGVTGLAAVLLARPLGLRGPRRGGP